MLNFLALLAVSESRPFPHSLLEESGFQLREKLREPRFTETGYTQIASYNDSAGASVHISARWISSKTQDKLLPKGSTLEDQQKFLDDNGPAVPPFMKHFSSNLPPSTARMTKGIGVSVRVINQHADIICFYWPQIKTTPRGFSDPQSFDLKTQLAFIERISRHTLARASGLRLDVSSSGIVSGSRVNKAACRITGMSFGDLNQWAKSSGWTLTEDPTFGFYTLKKGSDWAVLPLGAEQIKVNGVWKEMGDSAAYFNDSLYLPAAGLKHLREAE